MLGKGPTTNEFTYTYMKAVKFRLNGSVTNYTAVCKYNHELNDYEKDYSLGYLNFDRRESKWNFDKASPEDLPRWARK